MKPLCDLEFAHRYVDALPADPARHPGTRLVADACYSFVEPTKVAAPHLLAWSGLLADELGLMRPGERDASVQILAGNALARGMRPWAARYAGHQFGHWADQLGDGRAISLGELTARDGRSRELQLKGAGMTPYSRHADGRAVLRSSLREFLCSEAMHALGVPTTRALSLVATGETVVRDMFYDGRPRAEPGAIVCRVAPSFVRFGNFEMHAARGEQAILRQLADFVIAEHFPELDGADPARYARWFREVCERTARLMAHWMRVGFVHGVMNTDNMSILGLTIDYGPYGWLETWDPDWTPNTTDFAGRRYAYARQPQIGAWNLARLAGSLKSLFADEAPLHEGLDHYRQTFARTHRRMLADKLGFAALDREDDDALLEAMYALLAAQEIDVPIFFRNLTRLHRDRATTPDVLLRDALYDPAAFDGDAGVELRTRWSQWFARYRARSSLDPTSQDVAARCAGMDLINPLYLPRNYLAQQAIEAAEAGDVSVLERLLTVLREPYREQQGCDDLAARRPEWARDRPGCSALSCSS